MQWRHVTDHVTWSGATWRTTAASHADNLLKSISGVRVCELLSAVSSNADVDAGNQFMTRAATDSIRRRLTLSACPARINSKPLKVYICTSCSVDDTMTNIR